MCIISVVVLSALSLTGSVRANTLVQVGLCLDSSGSISISDWGIIVAGVAAAIRNNIPDGSDPTLPDVELTVVVFSTGAITEVPPTVITAANKESVATTVEAMGYWGGTTAMDAGIDLVWDEMHGSPNFAGASKQIINIATDGVPNSDAAAEASVAAAVSQGLDELDAEAIGSGPDLTWMVGSLVWPQPGTLAPPYTAGWVEHVADADAFAAAIGQKFEILTKPPNGVPEFSMAIPLATSIATLIYLGLRKRHAK